MPGVLGGLMVPLIAGVFDWQAAMLSGALFALIGALLWLFIEADRPLNVGQAVVDTSG